MEEITSVIPGARPPWPTLGPAPVGSVADALRIVGSLGRTAKMPGLSYGLPAQACRRGKRLVQDAGAICAHCYALKGRYRRVVVQKAQAERLEAIRRPQWAEAMAYLLDAARDGRLALPFIRLGDPTAFRWHDSGDLQSLEHLLRICQVARLTPGVRHWLPTREIGILIDFVRRGHAVPDNLVIRLSADRIDRAPEHAWPWISTVGTGPAPAGSHRCPARAQGNMCGACRACWSHKVKHVDYPLH